MVARFISFFLRTMPLTTGLFSASGENQRLSFVFRKFVPISKDTGCSVQMLRTDRGGEFANKTFDQYLAAHSIRREYTTLYTPEHNFVVERENQIVMEGVRSCLHQVRINL